MDLFSLSHPQRRTWYMENEHPDSAVNNIAFYVTCDRVSDPGVLEEAINRCLQDNDALRIQLHKECRYRINYQQIKTYNSQHCWVYK